MNDPWDDTTHSQAGIVVTAAGLRVPVAGTMATAGWPGATARAAGAPPAASAQYRGVGPKGYRRSDSRVREHVCDQLLLDPYLDASRIVVRVANGRVVLTGSVPNERMRESAVAVASNAAAGAVDDKLQVAAPAQRPSRVTAARSRSRKTAKTRRGGQR